MLVILSTGKQYLFTEMDGKTYFRPSPLKEGIVKDFHSLTVGDYLSLTFYPVIESNWEIDYENASFFKTSAIISEIKKL